MFVWHPPAAAGDIIALLADPPARICLVDGLFDSRAAPWHKELLLLIEAGTLVFGAASMGALRAAELDRLGMVGVGAIYRAFRSGRLSGDDEVALIHAPARLDWIALTVPMVEVRATLAAAVRTHAISSDLARALRTIAHDIHYEDRDWAALQKQWQLLPGVDAELCECLRELHVPLKQHDALAGLAAAAEIDAPSHAVPVPPRTCFIEALARTRLPGRPLKGGVPTPHP